VYALLAFLKDDERFNGNHGWDMGIYPEAGNPREQLFSMVGCCKAKDGDYRVLQPYGPERPYNHFIAQSLTGQEEMLELPDEELPPIVRRARKNPRNTRISGKPAWLNLPDGELVVHAMQGLCANGMVSGYLPGVLKNNLLPFETTGPRPCCHGGTHDSNTCGVSFRRDGAILYHCNADAHCELEPPIIGSWRKTLASRMSVDALLDSQATKFDSKLLESMEAEVWAENPKAKKLPDCPSYGLYRDFCIEYYNRFFVHVLCGKPEIVQFELDDEGVRVSYERRNYAHAKEATMDAGESFGLWAKSSKKNRASGFFAHPDPDHDMPHLVNLCVGSFPMARVKEEPLTAAELERINPILRAFEVDICRDEPAHYNYVYNWLAFPLQKLGRKNNTAILVFGAQGVGKTLLFGDLMRSIWGSLFICYFNKADMLGRFNKLSAGKVYVHCDEAGMAITNEPWMCGLIVGVMIVVLCCMAMLILEIWKVQKMLFEFEKHMMYQLKYDATHP